MPDKFAQFPIAAAPQAFTWGGRALAGFLTGWSGAAERRYVVHKFLKRPGQRVEDYERDGRWIQVRLLFLGADCAKDYQGFESFVHQNPSRRLDHPIAGQYQAFCTGPQQSVEFSQALDKIVCDVKFIEDELNAQVPSTAPDVATASQNVASQQILAQQSIGQFLGALGKAQTQVASVLNQIDAGLNTIQSLTTGIVATMQGIVNGALGTVSQIAGTVNLLRTQSDQLQADVSNFITAATDLFTGSDTSATAAADNIANTLGTVQTDAVALEATLVGPMPQAASQKGGAAAAGSAQAVRDNALLIDACLTLQDAVYAQLPPVVQYTLPATIGIMPLSQQLMGRFGILGRDALAYASSILALNRVPTPHAIPAGTILVVPTA